MPPPPFDLCVSSCLFSPTASFRGRPLCPLLPLSPLASPQSLGCRPRQYGGDFSLRPSRPGRTRNAPRSKTGHAFAPFRRFRLSARPCVLRASRRHCSETRGAPPPRPTPSRWLTKGPPGSAGGNAVVFAAAEPLSAAARRWRIPADGTANCRRVQDAFPSVAPPFRRAGSFRPSLRRPPRVAPVLDVAVMSRMSRFKPWQRPLDGALPPRLSIAPPLPLTPRTLGH